jgi:indolepyruvate ferredoxin oxidoreductase beta subunit
MGEGQVAMAQTVNVLIAGVGGQGVLRASQVLSETLVRHGYDVKQSEVHGMSQRGGSVVSEVRFGEKVRSPLMPHNGADYILALDDVEGIRTEPRLRPETGRLIDIPVELQSMLSDPRDKNMAVLGRLSRHLVVTAETWREAIRHCMPPKTVENNLAAFEAGRTFDDG